MGGLIVAQATSIISGPGRLMAILEITKSGSFAAVELAPAAT
jgi:hypothetical protein